MPSDKKRINLTVPDKVYEDIQAYKEENGIENDASVCLQLIVRQLKSEKDSKAMLQLLKSTSVEQLLELSREGLTQTKDVLDKADKAPGNGG